MSREILTRKWPAGKKFSVQSRELAARAKSVAEKHSRRGSTPPARQSRPIEEPRTTRAMTDKEAGFEMWPQLAAGKHVVRPATPRRPYDAPERSRARAIVPSRAPRARATD